MAAVDPASLKPGKYLRFLLKHQGGEGAVRELWGHRVRAALQDPQRQCSMLELERREVAAGVIHFSREELALCQREFRLAAGALDHFLPQRQQERLGRPEPHWPEEQQPERGRRTQRWRRRRRHQRRCPSQSSFRGGSRRSRSRYSHGGTRLPSRSRSCSFRSGCRRGRGHGRGRSSRGRCDSRGHSDSRSKSPGVLESCRGSSRSCSQSPGVLESCRGRPDSRSESPKVLESWSDLTRAFRLVPFRLWGSVKILTGSIDRAGAMCRSGVITEVVTDVQSEASKKNCRHPGIHPGILKCTMDHPATRVHVANVIQQLAALQGQRGEWLAMVAVLCQHGRHRSVSVAEVLAFWLRSNGVSNVIVQHLNEHKWPARCKEGQCRECGPRWGQRDDSPHVVDHWG